VILIGAFSEEDETAIFAGLVMATVFFLEGFVLHFDLMAMVVGVGVADATDLRGMRGRMVGLGVFIAFVFASAVSAQIIQTERRCSFGVGEGMEEAMVKWSKDGSMRII